MSQSLIIVTTTLRQPPTNCCIHDLGRTASSGRFRAGRAASLGAVDADNAAATAGMSFLQIKRSHVGFASGQS